VRRDDAVAAPQRFRLVEARDDPHASEEMTDEREAHAADLLRRPPTRAVPGVRGSMLQVIERKERRGAGSLAPQMSHGRARVLEGRCVARPARGEMYTRPGEPFLGGRERRFAFRERAYETRALVPERRELDNHAIARDLEDGAV